MLASAALLAIALCLCATPVLAKKRPKDVDKLLVAAEAEVGRGRIETALVAFDAAAQADPTRKEPWVRTAQLQFDAGNYGRAIVAAEEVLKRDPGDLVADSVLTVGGLRVASQSLQRLRKNGVLETSDTARKEAEQLAATMRATLGDDILVSDEQKAARAAATRRRVSTRGAPRRSSSQAAAPAPQAPPAVPAAPKPRAGNPFEVLGGN
ncbi:tetratricopeptide repeat protein [Lysobacter koreensis]|uniref:Tetratricopeptide repeat protein n=1 Tax=Lysobacter koreensis TaxID=266122 RepID=A0ABW2YNA7_9GAMM